MYADRRLGTTALEDTSAEILLPHHFESVEQDTRKHSLQQLNFCEKGAIE